MGSFPETYSDLKFSSLISILFPKKIGGENLTKNQSIFHLVVILVILITLSYDDELK